MRWTGNIDWLYYDNRPSDTNVCVLRIHDGEVVLSYEFEGAKPAVLRGPDAGDGHYGVLKGWQDESVIQTTLHIRPGDLVGEGYWTETSDRSQSDAGLCRVRLKLEEE